MSLNWSTRDAITSLDNKTASLELEGGVGVGVVTSVTTLPEEHYSSSTEDTTGTGESGRNDTRDNNNVLCVGSPIVVATDSSVFTISTLLSPQTPTPTNVEASSSTTTTMAGIKTEMQPLHTVSNSTVSAAADSSDNQPPTPTPDHQQQPLPPSSSTSSSSSQHHHHHQQQQQQLHHQHQHQQQQQLHHQQQQHQQQQPHHHLHHPLYGSGGGSSLASSNQMYQDMHSYHPPGAGYLGGYEQFYHAPPAGVDYGSAMQQLQQNHALSYQMQNQSLAGTAPGGGHTDYKVMATSQRFHPYLNNGGLHHLSTTSSAAAAQNSHSIAAVTGANGGGGGGPAATNNTSSSVSNSSLSPRVVSSSSPSQNNSSANHNMAEVKSSMANRTPTPSSSKQCNKCGLMCATDAELNEHYTSIHGVQSSDDLINSAAERSASSASERGQYHPFAPYIKEEPPSSDILDLDSQKMVYPPQPEEEAAAAVVNSGLHPMQRPMTWPQELHPAYMAGPPHLAAENKHHPGYYSKQEFAAIKSEFHPIKSEYVSPTNFGNTSLKPSIGSVEYGQPIAPQTRPDDKPFGSTDLTTGNNPVSSSPSEFPSTTTPQDNISQYRNFEPTSSSLPSSGGSAKSATWKSNEARRPKTYNCTACNKWFTSSGHLKRHYNTTLHKNAVKSSGQPDPATMPISAHHHPARDPNSKHHRNSQARQPPPIPPEPPRSPDFSSQYTTQSPNGFPTQAQQQQQSQTFQQYHPQSNLNSSSVNGHPNGLAGPSVQASHPRGLLTISNTEVSIMEREEEQLHNSNNNNNNLNLHLQLEDPYHQQELQGSSPNSSPSSSSNNNNNNNSSSNNLEEDYQSTISLHQPQQQQQQLLLPPLRSPHIITHHQYREVPHHHQQEPTTIFNTDTTIHNIMDQQQLQQQPPQQLQQQYIISPLAINTTTPITLNNTTTTIPSYQHLQQQVAEHQQNYPTIIGNDVQDIIQLNNFVDVSSFQSNSQLHSNNNNMQQQLVALDANGHIVQLIHQPSMLDLQRFSGGIPSFKENLMQAPSPTVPESYYTRMSSPFGSQSSPQEADIPPMHNTASGPQQHDQTNPYSPTVSSSTTTTTTNQLSHIDELQQQHQQQQQPIRKAAVKRKRETTTKATSTTLPTGRLKCEECNKEFTKICYLTQHNKSFHSGEQPYRCQKCGKRFQSEDIYESHLDRHKSQDKPHKCDLCPKQFHHKTDLRRHKEAIHTGFKAHTCEMCNKSFCRKDHLRKHCDIHTRPKPVKKARTASSATTAANRKQTTKSVANSNATSIANATAIITPTTTTTMTAIESINSPTNQIISSLEDNITDSSSNNSILQSKMEIKVESYAMAGEELVYM